MNAQLGNDTDTWKPALGNHAEGTVDGKWHQIAVFLQSLQPDCHDCWIITIVTQVDP